MTANFHLIPAPRSASAEIGAGMRWKLAVMDPPVAYFVA